MFRLAHLRHDGEEGRRPRVGKYERGAGGERVSDRRIVEKLIVGDEHTSLWRCGRAVLKSNCDGYGKDCGCVRLYLQEKG